MSVVRAGTMYDRNDAISHFSPANGASHPFVWGGGDAGYSRTIALVIGIFCC